MKAHPSSAGRPGLRAGLLSLALATLAACGSPPQETRTFTLELADVPLQRGPALPGTLQVQNFSSAAVYGDRRLAWRDMGEPQQIHLYNQYLWSSAPPQLFQQELFRCLAGTQAADSVIPGSVPVAIDYALTGDIERLELQLGARGTAAVLRVTLYLTDRRSRELLWSEQLGYREPIPSNTPEDTATAFGEAMTKLCYDTAGLLRETAAGLQ
ncbi:MAG TPA: ABC-type transport auxiliary lipoprotein family protein [Kiloniellaceae bacterium]|nr:ABC-type transport auxiliary lipoprotein family protein [Kiloniellaceae bacterium]